MIAVHGTGGVQGVLRQSRWEQPRSGGVPVVGTWPVRFLGTRAGAARTTEALGPSGGSSPRERPEELPRVRGGGKEEERHAVTGVTGVWLPAEAPGQDFQKRGGGWCRRKAVGGDGRRGHSRLSRRAWCCWCHHGRFSRTISLVKEEVMFYVKKFDASLHMSSYSHVRVR